MNYNILIGGAAGQGMNTLTNIVKTSLKRHGYFVFTSQVYMSRIRGGHNFFQIRFSDKPVKCHHPSLDLIIALDQLTVSTHLEQLNKTGLILCDESVVNESFKERAVSINAKEASKEINHSKGLNIILLGGFIKLFGLDLDIFKAVILETFKTKLPEENLEALVIGYEKGIPRFKVAPLKDDNNIIINGNTSIAIGAIAAGIGLYAAYPMTPATSIMNYLNKRQKETGIVVEQAEDEIAAIHIAIGASFAGVRSMTGSSGGGISLMVEALGLTSVAEIPLVIVDVQRPGPATGLPTKTSQSDLSFLLAASQDELPRMIMAVRDPEDAFYQTARAFDLADKYQMLIIILNDEYLADASMTIPKFDFSKVSTEQYLASEEEVFTDEKYKRYKFTESGVSPRIIPGQYSVPLVGDSHEHDEFGNVIEDSDNRIKMHDKRLRKLVSIEREIQEPEYVGDTDPEYVLVGFGSTYGAISEAVDTLKSEGVSIGALQFGDLYPLPKEQITKYSKTSKLINVEINATGQMARLIRMETGITFSHNILKYDGRQIDSTEIVKSFREVL